MENSVHAGVDDARQRVDSELAFYRAITVASENSQYVEFMGVIENRLMENLRFVVVKNAIAAEWGSDVLNVHRVVFNAARDGAVEAARNATRVHHERAAKRLTNRADFDDV